jgi:hypothetical protein
MPNPVYGRFATLINCIDGRTQLPAISYMKTKYNVDYVDVITEPSPVKAIAEQTSAYQVYSIQQRLMLSQEKHGSQHLGLVAHYDCLANPVEKTKQLDQLRQSLVYMRLWGFKGAVVGLWIDENWIVQEIPFTY